MEVSFSFFGFFPAGQFDAFDFEDAAVDEDKLVFFSLGDDAFDDTIPQLNGEMSGFQFRGIDGVLIVVIGDEELVVAAFHGDVIDIIIMFVVDEHG